MRVLLVEDDPSQLLLMTRQLVAASIDVVPAQTIYEAAAASGPLDAIVTDYSLLDGTAREVIARRPGIPTLVVSGYDRPVDWSFGPWLLKPVLGEELAVALRQLVREAHR